MSLQIFRLTKAGLRAEAAVAVAIKASNPVYLAAVEEDKWDPRTEDQPHSHP